MHGINRFGILWIAPFLSFCLAGIATAQLVDRILAVVNGEIVTMSDVTEYQELFMPESDSQTVLEKLIDQKVLSSEARKFGFASPSEDSVDESRRKLEERLGGPTALENLLNRLSLIENDLNEMIKVRLMVADLMEQQVNLFVFVSGQDIDEYYRSHKEEFSDVSPDEARSMIQERLVRQRSEAKRRDYIRRLRDRAVIRIN